MDICKNSRDLVSQVSCTGSHEVRCRGIMPLVVSIKRLIRSKTVLSKDGLMTDLIEQFYPFKDVPLIKL